MKRKWRLFRINEADTVAAKSLSEAVSWYKEGICEDIEEVMSLSYSYSRKHNMWYPMDELKLNKRRGRVKSKELDGVCTPINLRKALELSLESKRYRGPFLLCSTEW